MLAGKHALNRTVLESGWESPGDITVLGCGCGFGVSVWFSACVATFQVGLWEVVVCFLHLLKGLKQMI